MSSLRNAVKRVTHKERSQPSHRAHLGILEKHKDYTKRARDYHSKQEKISILREKADQRNPDEFYFGMHKSYLDRESGRHKKLAAARQKELERLIGPDAIKVMKQQDLIAVKLQLQQDNKKIEKMQQNLHLIGDSINNNNTSTSASSELSSNSKKRKYEKQHTIFVNTEEELEVFDAPRHFSTVPDLMDRSYNRPTVDQLILQQASHFSNLSSNKDAEDLNVPTEKQIKKQKHQAKLTAKRAAKDRISTYKTVERLQRRKEKLHAAESHLETEKNLCGQGKRRKVKNAENGKPAVYKWNRIRKK